MILNSHTTLLSKVLVLSVAGVVMAMILLAHTPVNAQNGLGIKIQPIMLDESVDPGTVLEGVLHITNEYGGSQTYFINRRNIEGMDDNGTPIYSAEFRDDPLEVASWLKPSVESVFVEVGQTVEVPYEIVVPDNATPGSHHAAFFVTRQAQLTTESGAGVGFHVASIVNLRVNGDVVETMLYREFSTDKVFYREPSVLFASRLDNTGTIHQRPLGIITITNMFGNKVGQVTYNDRNGAILAKSDRVFEVRWNGKEFAFGRYTASASVVFGYAQRWTVTRKTTFWVIPIKDVGMVLGGIVLLLLALIVGVRTYVSRALKRAGATPLPKDTARNVTLAQRMVRTILWLVAFLALLFIGTIVFFA